MIRFVYKNLWRSGTVLAASSENAQFPKENTQEDIIALPFRTAAGDDDDETVDNDFGAACEYNFIALLGHNITDGATIEVKGADDAAFTTNVVTDALTHNGNNIFAFLSTARTKRYCRVRVQDASNPSGYIEIGAIVVGKYVEFNRHFSAYSKSLVDESETEKTPAGNLFTLQERATRQTWSLPFKGIDDTAAAVVDLMAAELGIRKAMIFCTDPTTPNSSSYWAHFTELPRLDYSHTDYWSTTFELEEVV